MKKILLTVLVWILPTVLWGKQLSDKQYIFQRIDVREGLSYQVNCMTVSHRTGHAWMGTKNGIYNPQIQISAESGTKRSIFRQKNKTKRSKNRLHTTLIKPEQKVNEDLCSGFVLS